VLLSCQATVSLCSGTSKLVNIARALRSFVETYLRSMAPHPTSGEERPVADLGTSPAVHDGWILTTLCSRIESVRSAPARRLGTGPVNRVPTAQATGAAEWPGA
jgi:hypothetical protein